MKFEAVYLRHFYASICEECIKGYSSYEFVQSVDSLIEEVSDVAKTLGWATHFFNDKNIKQLTMCISISLVR